MRKAFAAMALALCFNASNATEQERSEELSRLEFLVGEWTSASTNQATQETSPGSSSVRWGVGGKWLEWKFTMPLEQDRLEVTTLITYQEDNKRYAFYSFNPIEGEPIPHFGNWLDEKTLRLETDFKGEEVRVEFTIGPDGGFQQSHSRLDSSGRRFTSSITKYRRQR